MRDAGMLHPRHFFSPGTFFLQRCKVTGELTAEEMLSAWDSADATNTFFQALFMEILKMPGIVRMQRTLLFQALLMEKVLGKMRNHRTLFWQALFLSY